MSDSNTLDDVSSKLIMGGVTFDLFKIELSAKYNLTLIFAGLSDALDIIHISPKLTEL